MYTEKKYTWNVAGKIKRCRFNILFPVLRWRLIVIFSILRLKIPLFPTMISQDFFCFAIKN